ncbi:unnamed protein product [Rotaria sordida]|uniref:Uncharacterized protein n=1 Tax=Rotaria sordida TaxID=392033 RepID=A0A814DCW6_9BILA|nr:unnamed protein product [Rotaria sordida]
MSNYTKALEFYEKALKIFEKALPPNHPDLATSYISIGTAYHNVGNYSKALEFYEKALKIFEKALPPNHPNLATSYDNIGSVYKNMGNYSKALEFYEKALKIREKALPSNHPDLATSYISIGTAYHNMGNYSKALEFYEKALKILEKALPPNHPNLATSYSNIGSVYDNMGNYSKALEFYEKTLKIFEKALPPNHPSLATSYNNIGQVYNNMGDYSKALEFSEKALKIFEKALPPNHPNLATSYSNIGLVYDNMSNYSKALEFYEKALKIFEKALPPNHPNLATFYTNIGSVYKNTGNYSKALSFLENALTIAQKSLPPIHPMMIISVFLIIFIFINPVDNSHFRGGMISWRRATDEKSVLNTKKTIIIDQRYAWSKSAAASACTSSTISSFGLIGENTVSVLKCQSSLATCTSAQYTANISTYVPCTDYNTALGMSFGYSSTTVNLTVISTGIVVGYVVSGAWLSLQLSSGGWSMMTYINMKPRLDNELINSSPTSSISPIVYVPASSNISTSIDIPMDDIDGDNIECRFAKASNILGGVTVDECNDVCKSLALPASTQLISGNNTCTLMVTLPSIGYYAVAIQLEDFIENITTPLSSVPLQFLLLAYDASNPTSTCTSIPVITSIPPDLPLPGDTVTVQVTVLYTAMVIAQSGCQNDTDTSITNFITSSPPGMLKSNLPYTVTSTSYAISLTWTPAMSQLGQTYTFCAVAIDSNYYSSNQYCFNLFVGPKTTTTTTTSTTTSTTSSSTSTTSTTTTTSTSTSSTSTTSTTTTSITTTTSTSTTSIITTEAPYNCIPLLIGLGVGLGLPLLLLVSFLALCYLFRWCPGPIRSILQYRYGHQEDMHCKYCQRSILDDDSQKINEGKLIISEDTRRYRQQYLNTDDNPSPTNSYLEREYVSLRNFSNSDSRSILSAPTTTITRISSLVSPSINTLPTENFSRILSSSSSRSQPRHANSILSRLYSKQIRPI